MGHVLDGCCCASYLLSYPWSPANQSNCFFVSLLQHLRRLLVVFQFLAGSDDGSYENAIDGLVMVSNNMTLLAFVLAYWLSIAFYNFSSLSVTKSLTTGTRTSHHFPCSHNS